MCTHIAARLSWLTQGQSLVALAHRHTQFSQVQLCCRKGPFQ